MPLSAREFEDLAPIMASLESLALQLTDPDELRTIGARLAQLSAEFDQEIVEHALVVSKDDEWHDIMLSGCPNQRLIDVDRVRAAGLPPLRVAARADEVMIERVAAEHADDRRAHGERRRRRGIRALTANWMNGMQRILKNSSSPYFTA